MSRRRATSWLPHPAARVTRTLTCPTGFPRHATEHLAHGTKALAVVPAGLDVVQCDQCNGGWHLVRKEENTP